MNIAVCVKQVPEEIRVNIKTGTLIREAGKGLINPCDKNAVELAVTLKELHGGKITLVSMGPRDVENILLHGLAMGADRAFLISDGAFVGSDTLATALALAKAIEKAGDFQLVLCGNETIDSGTRHVGPQIAQYLGIPQVTCVVEVDVIDGKISAKRRLDNEYERVEAAMPCLMTVLKDINEPRIPTYLDIYEAAKKESGLWGLADLGLRADQVGILGSPTRIADVFVPEAKRQCRMLEGRMSEVADNLVEFLRNDGLL